MSDHPALLTGPTAPETVAIQPQTGGAHLLGLPKGVCVCVGCMVGIQEGFDIMTVDEREDLPL